MRAEIAVLANPSAGRGRHRALFPDVLERLGGSGRAVRAAALLIEDHGRASNIRFTLPCVGYDWLPWALASLVGITPDEVAEVLSAPRRLPRAAMSGGVPFVVICGRTLAGRPLIVAVRRVGDLDQQIIGARVMTPSELATFERWETTA